MCLSLYAMLIKMLMIDLQAKNQQYLQGYGKQSENCSMGEV